MRTWLVPLLLLSACGGGDDGEDIGSSSVSVEIPPAQPYRNTEPVPVVDPAPGGPASRPRLDAVTGVCMGRWTSRYPSWGEPIAVTVDRKGTYSISGGVSASGAWSTQGQEVRLGDGRMRECGRDIAHLAIEGRDYSLRRRP